MLSQSGTSVITSTESPISVNYVQQNEQQNECECQTNFDSSKGLKVNYFANGFENAQDYLRAKRHRRLLLSNEKRRKAEIAAYDYMIQIYLFFWAWLSSNSTSKTVINCMILVSDWKSGKCETRLNHH